MDQLTLLTMRKNSFSHPEGQINTLNFEIKRLWIGKIAKNNYKQTNMTTGSLSDKSSRRIWSDIMQIIFWKNLVLPYGPLINIFGIHTFIISSLIDSWLKIPMWFNPFINQINLVLDQGLLRCIEITKPETKPRLRHQKALKTCIFEYLTNQKNHALKRKS